MSAIDFHDLTATLVPAAAAAGTAILRVREQGAEVSYKQDKSPVTAADEAAEAIILAALNAGWPGIPVVAEEEIAKGAQPKIGDHFFLVDALDGTKDFVRGGQDFTVNIALVEQSYPIFGLIYAPALGDCYVTVERGQAVSFQLRPGETEAGSLAAFKTATPLTGDAPSDRPFTAFVSRSHNAPAASEFLERFGPHRTISMGSSRKFGEMARGAADLYPRFRPTSEWDTAAGQAILEAAGGAVTTLEGERLRCGNLAGGFLNPFFVAARRPLKPGQLGA